MPQTGPQVSARPPKLRGVAEFQQIYPISDEHLASELAEYINSRFYPGITWASEMFATGQVSWLISPAARNFTDVLLIKAKLIDYFYYVGGSEIQEDWDRRKISHWINLMLELGMADQLR